MHSLWHGIGLDDADSMATGIAMLNLPDVIGDTLVRIVHQGACLHLIEGPIRKVVCGEFIGHPFSPL